MTVLVMGLGASGRAMVAALQREGRPVRGADDRPDLSREDLPADTVLGSLDSSLLDGIELVVTSPGLSPSHVVLSAAVDGGIPVWSEPELAWRLNDGRTRLIGVTGTNGKTTTTQMIAACLAAPSAGNIGVPLVTTLTVDPPPVVVAELSSFQLHFCSTLRPEVAVLLNIADDHLDWHGGADDYAADKAKLWQAQTSTDVTVVNAADAGAAATVRAHPPPGRVINARVGDGMVDPTRLSAAGPHNAANATAAAHAATAAGAELDHVRKTLEEFRTGAHRLELVATIDGVDWVNDSKATNPHAALAALESFDDIVWIAGGLNKGLSFDSLTDVLRRHVRHVLTVGSCGPQIAEVARAAGIPTDEVDQVAAAVVQARRIARPGDTVLLAPAAASMDQFTDYAHRGDTFRDAVKDL